MNVNEALLELFKIVVEVVAKNRGIRNYRVPRARHLPIIALGSPPPSPGVSGSCNFEYGPVVVFVYTMSPDPVETLLHELAHAAELYLTGKVSGYGTSKSTHVTREWKYRHGEELAMAAAHELCCNRTALALAIRVLGRPHR